MIKQGVAQEKNADLTSMNQLPLIRTLPHLSRGNMLNRAGYPKPFTKDKLQAVSDRNCTTSEDDRSVDLSELNPVQHIQHLERSIMFLKQQHGEVLNSLHEEIDHLKKDNKDLQFKIVMSQKQQQQSDVHMVNLSEDSRKSRAATDPKKLEKEDKLDELKIIFLEEEIKELKHALRESRNRNTYLLQTIERNEDVKKKQQHTIDTLKYQLSHGNVLNLAEQITSGVSIFNLPGGHQPTLAECEAVIMQLQQLTEQQKHELDCLKSDLQDVLYSHKWTPDAYLLAKAYIAEEWKDEDGKDKGLPKLYMKSPTRKLPDIAYIQHESMNLPALKQTVSNKAIERKKRTQIIQKARLKKELLH